MTYELRISNLGWYTYNALFPWQETNSLNLASAQIPTNSRAKCWETEQSSPTPKSSKNNRQLTNAASLDIVRFVSPTVFANTEYTLTVVLAVSVGAALDVLARGCKNCKSALNWCQAHLPPTASFQKLTLALHTRWSAHESRLTAAMKTSGGIEAGRVRATGLRIAFVDVDTRRFVGLESCPTETLTFYAFSVGGTLGIGFA